MTPSQKKPDFEGEVVIIKISRVVREIYEIGKKISFKKSGKDYYYDVGNSWMRIGSHTYKMRESYRRILRD